MVHVSNLPLSTSGTAPVRHTTIQADVYMYHPYQQKTHDQSLPPFTTLSTAHTVRAHPRQRDYNKYWYIASVYRNKHSGNDSLQMAELLREG